MPKSTKYILTVCFILAAAAVLVAGLTLVIHTGLKPFGTPQAQPARPVDPETVADIDVLTSGRSLTNEQVRPDGAITGDYHDTYAEYQDAAGKYQPIDTTVVNSTGDFKYENTANVHKTHFKSEAGQEGAVKFEVAGGRGIALSFIDSASKKSSAKGSTVSYAGVYDGVDVDYTVTNDALAEKIILNKKTGQAKFSQQMKLEGVYYKEQADGSITFHDQKTKRITWRMPRPHMYEQDDENKVNYGLGYEITRDGDDYIISKVISKAGQAWLDQAKYPVVIDPTIDLPEPTNFTIIAPNVTPNPPEGIQQALYLQFSDQTTAEDGWLVQTSTTGTGSWTDTCFLLTGDNDTWEMCATDINILKQCTGISKGGTGGTCQIMHQNQGINTKHYYRIVTVQWLSFDGDGWLNTISDATHEGMRDIIYGANYIYPTGWYREKRSAANGAYDTTFGSSAGTPGYVAWGMTGYTAGVSGDRVYYGGDGGYRLEKRSATTGEYDITFDSDGYKTHDPAVCSGSNKGGVITDLAMDATNIYTVGYCYDNFNNSSYRIIWKVRQDNGLFDTAFDGDGYLSSFFGSLIFITNHAIEVDNTYLYSGYVRSDTNNMLIKKDRTANGTSIFSNTYPNMSNFADLKLDSSSNIYWAGKTAATHANPNVWTVGRLLTNGASSYTLYDGGSGTPYAMAVDGLYFYLVGDDGTGHLRVEKRRLDTGALCTAAQCGTAFGTNGVYLGSAADFHTGVGVTLEPGADGIGYLYVVTDEAVNANKVVKLKMSDGTLDNLQCQTHIGCSFSDASYRASTPAYRYTLAAPVTSAPPALSSLHYYNIQYNAGGTVTVPASNPSATTEYCLGFYSRFSSGEWFAVAGLPGYFYSSDKAVGPEGAVFRGPALAPVRQVSDIGSDTPACMTKAEWDSALATAWPIIGLLPQAVTLSPNLCFDAGLYSQNGDDEGDTNDNYVVAPSATSIICTRARNSKTPIVTPNLTDATKLYVTMDNAGYAKSPTHVNHPATPYALQNTANSQYYNLSTGSFQAGEAWYGYSAGTTPNWGGLTGNTIINLSPNTCYTLRARTKNGNGVYGEGCPENIPPCPSPDDGWSAATGLVCTMAGQPGTVSVNDKSVNVAAGTAGFHIQWDNKNPQSNPNPTTYGITVSINSDFSSPIISAELASGTSGPLICSQGPSGTCEYTGAQSLAINTGYYIRVRAKNSNNIYTNWTCYGGACSGSRAYTLAAPPGTVSIPAANITNRTFYVEWQNNNTTTRLNPAGTNYQIQVSTNSGFTAFAHQSGWIVAGSASLPCYNIGSSTEYCRYTGIGSILLPSTGYYVRVQARNFVDITPTSWTCYMKSGACAMVYTRPNNPSLESLSCNYSGVNSYYCQFNLNTLFNPTNVTYEWQRKCNGTTGCDWTTVSPVPAQSYTNDYLVEDKLLTCDPDHTTYSYHLRAFNPDGLENPGSWRPSIAGSSMTLPPCAVTFPVPNHADQTVAQLSWLWNAPVGGAPVNATNGYEVKTSNNGSTCYSPTPFLPPTCYLADTIRNYLHTGLGVNTQYSATVRAGDATARWGQPATAYAYTSNENVSSISFQNVQTQQLTITSNAFTNLLGNPTSGLAGLWFRENGTGWNSARSTTNSITHSPLTPNTKYCYQGQTKNGDGDATSWLPPTPQCHYTYAATPIAPKLVRQISETSINIIIRPEDPSNPQGIPPAADTEYALCVTKYSPTGSPLWWHYANPVTGSIDHNCSLPKYDTEDVCIDPANGGVWTADKINGVPANGIEICNSASKGGPPPEGDGNKYWYNRVTWGDAAGKTVDLVTAGKYDFKFKARTGSSTDNSSGTDQCSGGVEKADGRCRETAFGSPATLFLVKNNLVGWAWSSQVGWISLNCLNRYNQSDYSCNYAGDWGVNTWFEPSRDINPMEGYAWSASSHALVDVCKNNPSQYCAENSECTTGVGDECLKNQLKKTGLGWISFNAKTCTNNMQKGCATDADCGTGNYCDVISTNIPPNSDPLYGFCYTGSDTSDVKYGRCSDKSTSFCVNGDLSRCNEPTSATCIFETCKNPPGDTCPDQDVDLGVEECRAYTTANFSGTTRGIEGWARLLSQKDSGAALGFTDWGWLKLNGTYDDGQGNTGPYGLTGTEVDSQQFFGDPDVNPNDLKLYSVFGWGWGAAASDYSGNSLWLNPVNISISGAAGHEDWGRGAEKDMVIDSIGDPHVVWSNYERADNNYEIYYLKLKAGKWLTASGVEYRPGAIDPIATGLNVSRTTDRDSRFPSLVLDANDNPYVVWQEGGAGWEGGNGLYFSRWENSGWTSAVPVEGGVAQIPVLKRDPSGGLHVAYRFGNYYGSEIYYKKSADNGATWQTVTGDGNNLNVSNTPAGSAYSVDVAVSDEGIPHITWMESPGHIFYRWWDGIAWVSASGKAGTNVCSNNFTTSCANDGDCEQSCTDDSSKSCILDSQCTPFICGQNRCISKDTSVNWGVLTCDGTPNGTACRSTSDCAGCEGIGIGNAPDDFLGQVPKVAFFGDGRPGIAWRDPTTLMFRQWNGSAWISVNNSEDVDDPDLVIAPREVHLTHDLFIDEDDRPHLVWDYSPLGGNTATDIYYSAWNGANWVTANKSTPVNTGDETRAPSTDDFNVSQTSAVKSWSPVFGFDRWGNPHVVWGEINFNNTGCSFGNGGVVDKPTRAVATETVLDESGQYLYIVGKDETEIESIWYPNWRIEKRRADSGELCTDSACGTGFGYRYDSSATTYTEDGVVRYTYNNVSDTATDIALDPSGDYLYVGGFTIGNNGSNIYIQKRLTATGAYDANFGGGGNILIENTGGESGTNNKNVSLAVDLSYLYVFGSNNDNSWHIEKRYSDDGSLVTSFGAGGVVNSNGGYTAQWITIDAEFMYLVGGNAGGRWRIEKRRLSNGSLVSGFDTDGIIDGSGSYESERAFQAILHGNYLYVVGNTKDLSNNEDFLVAKYDRVTGQPVDTFDGDVNGNGFIQIVDFPDSRSKKAFTIAADDNFIYFAGWVGYSLGNSRWRYERLNHNGVRQPDDMTSGGWQNGIIFEDGNNGHGAVDGRIDGIVVDNTYMYAVGSHNFGPTTWRIEKRYKDSGVLVTPQHSNCVDSKYPSCMFNYWKGELGANVYYCAASDVEYSKWMPGVAQSGLGWVEFMPAGALLGIPWVQTMFADIHASQGIALAPPPRGTGDYTSTYIIESGDAISGIPGYYGGTTTGLPTSQLPTQPGFSPLIQNQPSIQTLGAELLAKLDVDGLVNKTNGDKNRHGTVVVESTDTELSASLGNPILNNKVYYFHGTPGQTFTIGSDMYFMKGSASAIPATKGNGVIVVDGNLEINANVYYDKRCSNNNNQVCHQNGDCGTGNTCDDPLISNLIELPSAAIIVRGNIYINSLAGQVSAVVAAIDNPATATLTEGIISTGRKAPSSLSVSAGNDDTEVVSGSYVNAPVAASAKFGKDAGNVVSRDYLRFALASIPAGAEIKSAYLKLQSDGSSNGDFNARVYLLDYDNATDASIDFITTPNSTLYNANTSNSVNFPIEGNWTAGTWYQTPDLKAIVQRFVNRDNYTQVNYIGLSIREGDAEVGDLRGFRTFESGSAPQLVIEYAPRRSTSNAANGSIVTDTTMETALNDMTFGWNGTKPQRAYLQFPVNVPANAEILKAQVHTTMCNAGTAAFQIRQGVLQNYPSVIDSNPYAFPISLDVSELAQDVAVNALGSGQVALNDISGIITAFISRSDYLPGVASHSEFDLRLRRGSDSVEGVVGPGENRCIQKTATSLSIDYQIPLSVSGLFVAGTGYNFDRKYTKNLAPSERILYDGRVVANTPPGLSDFITALPIYHRVTP
ncbi:MAG: DNRLRE domain-containing protein [Patescibacteria group bacterium]